MDYKQVPLAAVKPDPTQPRQEFSAENMARLKASVGRHGIINPIIVEKSPNGYLIIDGERRFRAATALKLKTIPVLIQETLEAGQRLAQRFHLQEQHVNWSSFDKARSIADLQQQTKMGLDEMADFLGMDRGTIKDYLLLLGFSKRSQTIAVEKRIPYSYMREIARTRPYIDDVQLREKLEEALIGSLADGVITKGSELIRYRQAIVHGGVPIVRKIINSHNYTPAQALEDAGAAGTQANMRALAYASSLIAALRSAMKVGGPKNLNKEGAQRLATLMEEIEKYTDKAGANAAI